VKKAIGIATAVAALVGPTLLASTAAAEPPSVENYGSCVGGFASTFGGQAAKANFVDPFGPATIVDERVNFPDIPPKPVGISCSVDQGGPPS
jgi:hypothetical protein